MRVQPAANRSQSRLWGVVRENHSRWDGDRDGYLTDKEVEAAIVEHRSFREQQAALQTLRGRIDALQRQSNDEFGRERSGATTADLQAVAGKKNQNSLIVEEQFGLESRLAGKEPNPPLDPDAPKDLSGKFGTREYYLERYTDFRRRNPDQAAPDYYLNYGLKYFDRFESRRPTMEPATRGWIDNTAVKLQHSMEAGRIENGAAFAKLERDPKAFKDYAYDTHPTAYLEAGLNKVPARDLVEIPFVPDLWQDILTPSGLKQGARTAAGYLKIAGSSAFQVTRETWTA